MLIVRIKRRVTTAFFLNTCINPSYPESKEKSLLFRRLKLTVIHVSKNFRQTSYNLCICDTTRTTYNNLQFLFCLFPSTTASLNSLGMRRLGTSTRVKSRAKFLCFSVWLMVSKGKKMSSNLAKQASLILGDGTIYKGKLFGAAECVAGEVGKSKLLRTCNMTS